MNDRVFAWPVRVYYEDTDMSGVVYHARYLHFFERGRTEWLRHVGINQEQMRVDDKLAFTVASCNLKFAVAARMDDDLVVTTRISKMSRAAFIFEQNLYRRSDTEAANGMIILPTAKPLASAEVRAGCVSMETWRPQPLPAQLQTAVNG